MNKKIENIVFYKFYDPTRKEPMLQACIFYADKTVKSISYEEGKELAYEMIKEENISQADFKKDINTRRIFTLSGEEFEKRFKEFLGKGTAIVPAKKATPAIVIPPIEPQKKKEDEEDKDKDKEKDPITPIVVPPVDTSKGNNNLDPNKPRTSKKDKKKNKKKNKKKKGGFFQKLWVKVTAFILAGAMLFTGGYFLGRNTKSGDIINNNISMETQDDIQAQDQAFLNLIKKSTNEDQKQTMTHQSQSLDVFNRDFANKYVEEGKDVKASLTWDEMIALNLAYNTYSKDQIRIMFNGAEVDSSALSNAYKNATLQLMGSYVISTRENPVNSSAFLVDPEQKAFVEKYNNLFLTMKETTGKEQVAAINAFYAEIHKDFPITAEVREEGISHADGRKQLEPYKAAITPMVAAAEIMFQNVSDIDHTLSDKAIAYFNDLGLCNLVDEQFERAETITLAAETDEKQPLYTEFRDAKITELIYEGNYPTDDAHRDLSQLDAFQKWVNGRFEIVDGVNTGKVIPNKTAKPTTSTKTETTTTVTSNRTEAVDKAGEDAVKKAEDKVNSEIEKENQAAKAEAEKKAQEEAAKKQAEADAEKKKHEAEVEADNKDMQDKINNANDKINNGGTVTEEDFGDHGVDFDDEYVDENGNLDDSVKDITTVKPGSSNTGSNGGNTSGTPAGDVSSDDIYEYEEPYDGGMTNEEIVDAYIRSLEGQGANESAKTYQK